MSRKEYTESECKSKLAKLGCKFGDMNSFTVPKSKLGLRSLGYVDFLQSVCKMRAQYE